MSKPRNTRVDINGWIALDKPLNMTSTHAVALVRRLFNAKKGGHAGTLDPLATGVLPIALGEATKTVPYVMEGGLKTYLFTVSWGQERNTDDLEGFVTFESENRPNKAEIEALLPNYIGVVMQRPPQFSAVKIDGARAYDLARDGEEFEIKPREVEILSFKIIEHEADKTLFEVLCGKGTYVRSLARDLGRDLGCFGHVSTLRRTRVGPIDQSHCITPIALEALLELGHINNALHPVQLGLSEVPELKVSIDQMARLKKGQNVLLRGRDAPVEGHVWASFEGNLVAVCDIIEGALEPRRVFV